LEIEVVMISPLDQVELKVEISLLGRVLELKVAGLELVAISLLDRVKQELVELKVIKLKVEQEMILELVELKQELINLVLKHQLELFDRKV
jgi:hypothetical protein